MIRFITLVLWSLLATAGSYAQINKPPQRASAHIKLAYSGSLLYPGFRAGVEVPIRRLEVTKSRSGGLTKQILREQFLVASLGGYHHPTFHDNLYLTAEWTRRRTAPGGFFTEVSPGLGYSRTFLGGTTYTVDDAGQVTTNPLAGYSYGLLTLGGGLGYDFARKRTLPVAVFTKLSVLVMLPYNRFIYARPTLEIGLIYKPTRFLSRQNPASYKQR